MSDERMNPAEAAVRLSEVTQVELLASLIAARASMHALNELAVRGITPENVATFQREIKNGMNVIEDVARARGLELPVLRDMVFRGGGPGLQ